MVAQVYRTILTLHDELLFATREIGRVVETGRYLHNYALTYAFHCLTSPLRIEGKNASITKPSDLLKKYEKELGALKEIYITPAKYLKLNYSFISYAAKNEYIRIMKKPYPKNVPEFGTWLALVPPSSFECFILTEEALKRKPPYIRLGKTASKVKVSYEECSFKEVSIEKQPLRVDFPLNPLDLPIEPLDYEIEEMKPYLLYIRSSYNVEKALRIDTADGTVYLPLGLQYFVGGRI